MMSIQPLLTREDIHRAIANAAGVETTDVHLAVDSHRHSVIARLHRQVAADVDFDSAIAKVRSLMPAVVYLRVDGVHGVEVFPSRRSRPADAPLKALAEGCCPFCGAVLDLKGAYDPQSDRVRCSCGKIVSVRTLRELMPPPPDPIAVFALALATSLADAARENRR